MLLVVDTCLNCFLFSNGSIKIHIQIGDQSTKDMKPNEVEKKVAETLKSIKDQNIGERKVICIDYKGLFRVSIKSTFILNPFRHLYVRSSLIRPSVSPSVRLSVHP